LPARKTVDRGNPVPTRKGNTVDWGNPVSSRKGKTVARVNPLPARKTAARLNPVPARKCNSVTAVAARRVSARAADDGGGARRGASRVRLRRVGGEKSLLAEERDADL